MGNSKNIVIVVLAVALIVLAGWTYYTLTVTAPQTAEAECEAYVNATVIPQVTSTVQQGYETAIGQYEQLLDQLKQVPACAAVIPQ